MWHYAASIHINAPPEAVYAYLADLTRHAEWSSNVRRIRLVGGQNGVVGAEYEAFEDAPRKMTTYARITALEPPRRIAWQATDRRVFRTDWEFQLEPEEGGTRVTQAVTFHALNLLGSFLLYLARARVPAENQTSLERIRERLTGTT